MSRGGPESFCVSSQKVQNLHHEQDERHADAKCIWTGRSGDDVGCVRGSCTHRCSLGIWNFRVHWCTTRVHRCVSDGRQSGADETGAVLSSLVGLDVDDCFSLPDVEWCMER